VRVCQVAIKIIDTRKIKDEYVRANLHREARIMASLRHPNIIRLYETLKVRINTHRARSHSLPSAGRLRLPVRRPVM